MTINVQIGRSVWISSGECFSDPDYNELRFIPESLKVTIRCEGRKTITVDMTVEMRAFAAKLVEDNPYGYGINSYPVLPVVGPDQYAGFIDYLIDCATGSIHECICNIVNS